ncbi:UNVERIFIED_CONTAM: hypothetical protein K2H54_049962 [Gekko kuhli]
MKNVQPKPDLLLQQSTNQKEAQTDMTLIIVENIDTEDLDEVYNPTDMTYKPYSKTDKLTEELDMRPHERITRDGIIEPTNETRTQRERKELENMELGVASTGEASIHHPVIQESQGTPPPSPHHLRMSLTPGSPSGKLPRRLVEKTPVEEERLAAEKGWPAKVEEMAMGLHKRAQTVEQWGELPTTQQWMNLTLGKPPS